MGTTQTAVKWPTDFTVIGITRDNSLFAINPILAADGTSPSGTASSTLTAPATAGTYTLRVYAATGSPWETDYKDISVNVQAPVPASRYNVTFMVTDAAASPIKGATVAMNGIKEKTDASGKAVFNVAQGVYKYTVSIRVYKRYTGSASVTADMTIPVTLVHR